MPDDRAGEIGRGNRPAQAGSGAGGGIGTLFALYLAMVAAGYLALRMPGVMARGNELSHERALFLSANAATLTGFQQVIGVADFDPGSPIGPCIILALTAFGAFFSLVVGGLAAVRVLRLVYRDIEVIVAAAVVLALATLAGSAALLADGRGLFDAAFQSLCAFANCGLVLGKSISVTSWQVQAVLLPLATLGGLGLTVLMELYDGILLQRRLSDHARWVLVLGAGVYLVAFAILLPMWPRDPVASLPGWRTAVASSSAAAINTRTAGLPLNFAELPRPGQWFMVLLMMIGAAPAGTAGGIKTTTLLQLMRGIRDSLKERTVTRASGIAAVWLAAYLVLAASCWMVLLWAIPQMPADRLAFLSVSAASNVGLGHDPISIVGTGLHTLTGTMLAGRLLPLIVLWWMARTTRDADVLVG